MSRTSLRRPVRRPTSVGHIKNIDDGYSRKAYKSGRGYSGLSHRASMNTRQKCCACRCSMLFTTLCHSIDTCDESIKLWLGWLVLSCAKHQPRYNNTARRHSSRNYYRDHYRSDHVPQIVGMYILFQGSGYVTRVLSRGCIVFAVQQHFQL